MESEGGYTREVMRGKQCRSYQEAVWEWKALEEISSQGKARLKRAVSTVSIGVELPTGCRGGWGLESDFRGICGKFGMKFRENWT
jgi:hypothetical protein